ncbi:alpha-protein kinase 3 isoform X1 [Pantherophis guttatus]|uniref:non-specific serine/threonine protein kinase n=1 Tax=Pantherophis guttatus TaxID=94885 RepID=A0A6P9CYW2_PANGU|nr:alpha-protein kinase 3 isoform X1 [Pantherophis guttatus]
MGSRRRPLGRSHSGNGSSVGYCPGPGSDGEDNGPLVEYRPDRRSYLLSVRPENSLLPRRVSPSSYGRGTFCAIIAQLTEETQPVFETTLKSYAVSKDADAKFTCIVIGYPAPEVTWYKDNEEMDRYCGLPKYEILRHGNRHTLQLYKCQEEDAAIYQASARNNKGIVSCSGVLEVGTMTEYKIHQRWFAKLKRNAEAKLYEIEQSRKRGKENVEMEQLRRVSPDRFQRKRRLTGDVGMRSGSSLWDTEEAAKVRIPDGKACFGEDEKAKNREASLIGPALFPNDFIAGHLETEGATTNGDSSLESGEENGERNDNGFLQYIYETAGIVPKEYSAKKKKKEEDKAAPPNASQGVSQLDDGMQPRRKVSMQKEAVSSPKVASPIVNGRPVETQPQEKSPLHSSPSKPEMHFSLKEMYYDAGAKPKAEKKKVPESKAKAMEKTLPTRDLSNVDALPTTLKRAKAEEERNETLARQKSRGVETKHGKTEAPGTDRESNLQQFHHPRRAAEPTTEILMGPKMECPRSSAPDRDVLQPGQAGPPRVARPPLFEKENEEGEVLLIRETDLLDSALPEAEPDLQLPEAGPVDWPRSLQEGSEALTPVALEEKQLPDPGPSEGSENSQPSLSVNSGLQSPNSRFGEERKDILEDLGIKWSEKKSGSSPGIQDSRMGMRLLEDHQPAIFQNRPVTSQNISGISSGVPFPNGMDNRVQKEDMEKYSPDWGQDEIRHGLPPNRESKQPITPALAAQETHFQGSPMDELDQVAPWTEGTRGEKEQQGEAPKLLRDNTPSPQMPFVPERKRSSEAIKKSQLISEVATTTPDLSQVVSESPPPASAVTIPSVLHDSQEPALLSPIKGDVVESNQSVAHLLKDIKRETESREPSKMVASEEPDQQVTKEICVQKEFLVPPRSKKEKQESKTYTKKTEVRDKEKDTMAPDILSRENSRPPEVVVEETRTPEKDQNNDLVSSLKNYLLLLLKITSESDKSKARSPKQEAKMMEEKTPLSAIPKHLPDVGIAGLTPRTSRKIFEQVETDQLFQSAENLQLTPKTSRKLTGMINQELLACQKNLNVELEIPPLPCVPSIVVGGIGSEPAGLPHLPSSESVSETPAALPSATPEELASGARRKIFLPKTKTADEMEEGALEGQPWPKRDSPSVSPQQGRKSQALLQTSAPGSPPVEKRSPNLARKMATLEVPKMYQETAEESQKEDDSCSPLAPESVEESGPKVGESRKTNDPFKAPQVVRKIRAEQFSDASGNLKLWCQFFNILSDSKLIWYKDEVPIAEVKRSSGDEGQAALAIVQMSLKDCGVYQCTIQNEYGTDNTDFLLSSEVLSGFISKEEIEAGEEIEMTPMVFAKGLADSGFWGDKLFGRIMVEDLEVGEGFLRKACRARAIYGLEPVFESGHTGIIKVHNLIAFGGRSENTLVERNYDITIQECKIQNSSREYCKIFAAETRAIADFGSIPEIIPLYLIYRPANNIPYATMEQDLPGSFQCYCGREGDGNRLAPPNPSEIGQKCSAFQHWLYQWTNGNILVTDLEGVGWKVTNVKIATKIKGYQGLKESCYPNLLNHFVTSHQCNRYCELLALKSLEVPQPPPRSKGSRSPNVGRKSSSAQSSPQLQKKGLSSPQASRKGSVSPKNARKCPEHVAESQSTAWPKGRDSDKIGQLQ